MSARIAIVTASSLPAPDVDEELLLPMLPGGQLVSWDDPTVDWSVFDVVILRSTWNYTEHVDAFMAWISHVSEVSRLVNAPEVVRWNADKRYLADLAALGVPVVPTTYVSPGEAVPEGSLEGRIVVKPTVGAGSKGAALFADQPAAAAAHVSQLHAEGRVAMIQPYLDQVDARGETALVFIGGRFSHAARKAAILSREMSWSTGLYADEKIGPAIATEEELAIAHSVLAAAAARVPQAASLAYARVDLLPSTSGPVLLELELIEPSLFLAMDADAPARAAATFGDIAKGERDPGHITV